MTDTEKLKALERWCNRQQEWIDCERACPGRGGHLVAVAADMVNDVSGIAQGRSDEFGFVDKRRTNMEPQS